MLSLLHSNMDYLDRQYGICTRKAVNYHLDTVYQMTNLHLGKCQKRKKKKKKWEAKTLSWHGIQVCMQIVPSNHTCKRVAIQVQLNLDFGAVHPDSTGW